MRNIDVKLFSTIWMQNGLIDQNKIVGRLLIIVYSNAARQNKLKKQERRCNINEYNRKLILRFFRDF